MAPPRNLRALQAVEMALRTGSVKGAALALGITPAAAGQRIKALEDVLGVDLMLRGRSGLIASPALMAASGHLAAAFRELEAAAEMLELQRAQQIRVRIDPDLADLWLRPQLATITVRMPNTTVVVVSQAATGDGAQPAHDCAIAAGHGEHEAADFLFTDRVAAVGSADIAARIAANPPGPRLHGFPVIHYDGDAAHAPEADQGHRGIRFARLAGAIDAAVAGAGVLRCGLAMVRAHLADGTLVRIPGDAAEAPTPPAIHASFRRQALARPQVRHFRAWLLEQAADTRDWLAHA